MDNGTTQAAKPRMGCASSAVLLMRLIRYRALERYVGIQSNDKRLAVLDLHQILYILFFFF
jgi:hypothetical protein